MARVAVTYTFVVDTLEPLDGLSERDRDAAAAEAVEEYVHSVSDPFSDPVMVEELEAD